MEIAATGARSEVGLEHIERSECLKLLATEPLGRLAVAVPHAAPLVVPVNYVLDGEAIVFRSDGGTKLMLLHRGPVSFEVDSINPIRRTGWSVLVKGVAYEATHYGASGIARRSTRVPVAS